MPLGGGRDVGVTQSDGARAGNVKIWGAGAVGCTEEVCWGAAPSWPEA